MSKKNPLRRLSVALGLKESFKAPAVDPADEPSISKFLSVVKTSYLKDVKEDPAKAGQWTVVMGNEAGDLDSIASAIGYAWILHEVNKVPAIPLIQIERGDLQLRAENLHAFKLAGLTDSQEELLTLSEISEFKPFPSQKFALVDHNRLGSSFSVNNPNAEVVAVLDHHDDEKLYPEANPRTIAPCGSCASHVAALLPDEPLPDLAFLLLTAILIDTDGLKPGGKVTETDRDAAFTIAPKSTIANRIPPPSALSPIDHPNPDALYDAQAIKDLNAALQSKKSDVSHLSGFDLLRRDYKETTYTLSWAPGSPSIKVGLSTVPSRLKAWGSDGKLQKDAVKWMTQRNLTVLGVLTSFRDTKGVAKLGGKKSTGKGKHKREQAWIILEEPEIAGLSNKDVTTEVLAKRLWTGLEADETIQVKKHKKFGDLGKLPAGAKAKGYKQNNANATRKAVAPLVKNIFEGLTPASEGGS